MVLIRGFSITGGVGVCIEFGRIFLHSNDQASVDLSAIVSKGFPEGHGRIYGGLPKPPEMNEFLL